MKLTLLAVALLMASSLSFGQVMQKGDFTANGQTEGWNLNAGSGVRTSFVFVKFSKAFAKVPMVNISLTSIDAAAGSDGNVRVSVKAEQVTRDGFSVKISSWGDSRVAGVEGNWFAFTNK